MKKFFGVVGLIFCVFLASCNFNNESGKTSNLEFSFPVNDIIKATNNRAARNTGSDVDKNQEITFLAQISGSRGYYESQLQTIQIPDPAKSSDPTGSSTGISEQIKPYADTITFPFTQIPVGQTYTITIDVFMKTPYSSIDNLDYVISGKAEGIKVTGGKKTNVTVSAYYENNNNVNLVLEYADGKKTVFKAMDFKKEQELQDQLNNNPPNREELEKQLEELHKNTNLQIIVKGGKLYNKTLEGKELEIKDIVCEFDTSKNHFTNSSFQYKLCYETNGSIEEAAALKFKKGKCSVKQALLNINNCNAPVYFAISKDNLKFSANSAQLLIDTFQNYDVVQDNEYTFTFKKKQYEGNSNANPYIAQVKLSDIIGKVPATGDTVVLLLHSKEAHNSLLSATTDLYYKLTSEDFYTPATINGDKLFEDKYCINYPSTQEYLSLIVPLNFVSNPNDSLLFFLEGNNVSDDTIPVIFELTAFVYPASQKVFAFTLGRDPDNNNPYRYEYKTPVNLSLAKDNTVKAALSGSLVVVYCDGNSGDTYSYPYTDVLNGELYDGAYYTPKVEGDTDYFHVLSDQKYDGKGNVKTLNISENPDGGTFVFKNIRAPNTEVGFVNDFQFLCTAPLYSSGSVNQLLLIYDYNLEFSVE